MLKGNSLSTSSFGARTKVTDSVNKRIGRMTRMGKRELYICPYEFIVRKKLDGEEEEGIVVIAIPCEWPWKHWKLAHCRRTGGEEQ